MRLPKQVKVCGLTYTIQAASKEMDIRNAYGFTEHVDLSIGIDVQPPAAKVKETLLHEILHAADRVVGADEGLTERQVTTLARVLFQVFTENRAVTKFMFEDES